MQVRLKTSQLVTANTHLLFRGDIKLAQLMILMAEIDRHAYLGPSHEIRSRLHPYSWDTVGTGRYCPIIVTGDFNMEPHCSISGITNEEKPEILRWPGMYFTPLPHMPALFITSLTVRLMNTKW